DPTLLDLRARPLRGAGAPAHEIFHDLDARPRLRIPRRPADPDLPPGRAAPKPRAEARRVGGPPASAGAAPLRGQRVRPARSRDARGEVRPMTGESEAEHDAARLPPQALDAARSGAGSLHPSRDAIAAAIQTPAQQP